MKSVGIIIPCYNEEENVELFYKTAQKELGHLNYNFNYIYIDDGSLDFTKKEIQILEEKHRNVKGFYFSKNFGKEAAIIAGIDNSLKFDAAIIIDADLQMPLKTIENMLQLWEEGYKLVLTKKEKRKRSLSSFLASKFYGVYNKIAVDKIEQDALDFQLMDKEVLKTFSLFREKNRFFKGITGAVGYKYKVIEVKISDRLHGESKFSSLTTLFSYSFVSLTNSSTIFLKLSIYLGIFISFISFVYVFFIVCRKLIFGVGVEGWTSLMAVITLLFGVVLIVLGIIGYYIGLIYEEIKQRPLYILEDSKTSKDKE